MWKRWACLEKKKRLIDGVMREGCKIIAERKSIWDPTHTH